MEKKMPENEEQKYYYNLGYINGAKDMLALIFNACGELGKQVEDLEKEITELTEEDIVNMDIPIEFPEDEAGK